MTDPARHGIRWLLILNSAMMVALLIADGWLLVQQYRLAGARRAVSYSCGYLDGAYRFSGVPAPIALPDCADEKLQAKSHGFNP